MSDPGVTPGNDWLADWSAPQRNAWVTLDAYVEELASPHYTMAMDSISSMTMPLVDISKAALHVTASSETDDDVKDAFAEALSDGMVGAHIEPGSDQPAVTEARAKALGVVLHEWLPALISLQPTTSTSAQRLTGLWMRLSALEAADEMQRGSLRKIDGAVSRVDKVFSDTLNLRTEVTELVSQASVAANDAKDAAADIGSNELSAMYERYAKSHLRRAMWFRAWTIGLLGAGVVVAAALVLGVDFSGWLQIDAPAPTSEWAPVAYRLAVIAGLAALAAYLGRQAGNHRRLGEWASAIEIQLRAFNAFIAKIADPKVRDEAQLAFARRVLGPAPDASRVVESGSVLQPVVDALARRTG